MTGQEPTKEVSGQLLTALHGELVSRGVSCDLQDNPGHPRLGVYCPGESGTDSDLFDTVVVSRFRGEWWYCWREFVPICAVTPVTVAGQAIISELGFGDADGNSGVADLGTWRTLREVRLDMTRSALAGPAAGRPSEPSGPSSPTTAPRPPTTRTAGRNPVSSRLDQAAPGPRLAALRSELAARGVVTAGMTITRGQGILKTASGLRVTCWCGWLLWPAGRPSRNGRPLYAIHRAADPAGAGRRLARHQPWDI